MTQVRKYIVRDCWWEMPSGDNYWTDENYDFSTYHHGLYKSINKENAGDNDTVYIVHEGTGEVSVADPEGPSGSCLMSAPYVFRIEHSNVQPRYITLVVRAKAGSGGVFALSTRLYVNGVDLGAGGIGTFSPTMQTLTFTYNLTDGQAEAILRGRTSDKYDFVTFKFYNASSTSDNAFDGATIYGIEFYYNYPNTWDNYTTPSTTVTSYHYPTKFGFRRENSWVDKNGDIIDYSGVYTVSQAPGDGDVDVEYIENRYSAVIISGVYNVIYGTPSLKAMMMPSGGFSAWFNVTDPAPLTTLTRAKLNLRASLPPSGIAENSRDTFEIHGYNKYFKENDYKEDMLDAATSVNPRPKVEGYCIYGAGSVIENSGFWNYSAELNFVDGGLFAANPSGIIDTSAYRTVDIFNNLELQFVGLPSGVQISSMQLELQRTPNNFTPLYLPGAVTYCPKQAYVDTSGNINLALANGKWHHRGSLNEGEVFDVFYRMDEGSGAWFFPTTNNPDYVSASGLYKVLGGSVKEPTRRNYYRDPIFTYSWQSRPISYYRDAIVLGNGVDEHIIDFEDRLALTDEWTIYCMVGGSGTDLSWAGPIIEYGNDTNYSLRLFSNSLSSNGGCNMEVEFADGSTTFLTNLFDSAGGQPKCFWISYGIHNGIRGIQLCSHDGVDTYFSYDWASDSTLNGKYIKQYPNSTLKIGGHTPYPSYSLIKDNMHVMEFGFASGVIPLTKEVTAVANNIDYPTSTEPDKKFMASRVAIANYLAFSGDVISCDLPDSGVNWTVAQGSGATEWNTNFYIDDWADEVDGGKIPHSILNPTTTAFTNYKNAPSGIVVELCADHITNHVSGATVTVDIKFNSGATENWKVARTEFLIPSGQQEYRISGIQKHINMSDGPVRLSDVQSIILGLKTEYKDTGDEYYGNLTVDAVKVYFDSYCVASTGFNFLNLYTDGTYSRSIDSMDLFVFNSYEFDDRSLFIEGMVPDSGIMDLFTMGGIAREEMALYTLAHGPTNDNIALYTANSVKASGINETYPSGLNLFIEGIFKERGEIILYTKGLDPPDASNSMDLYVWCTTNPGIRTGMNLYTFGGYDPNYMLPLVIYNNTVLSENNYIPLVIYYDNTAKSDVVDLYMLGPSGINSNVDLFISGLGTTDGAAPANTNIPLYIARDIEGTRRSTSLYLHQNVAYEETTFYMQGIVPVASSIPMYIKGSGLFSNTVEMYTHGF